jgi:hypothetical protein
LVAFNDTDRRTSARGELGRDNVPSTVSGSIVGQHEFELRKILLHPRTQGLGHEGFVVVRKKQNANL